MTKLPAIRDRGLGFARGFSLVELMIAITLGLLIMTGLTTIFMKNSEARAEIERNNRQLENGRYAMSLLSEDLRMAGFLASFDPYEMIIKPNYPPLGAIAANPAATPPVAAVPAMPAMPDPCVGTVTNLKNSFFLHVYGVDNATAATTGTTAFNCLDDVRIGSDILVVRRASTCVAGPTLDANCDAPVAGEAFFQASNCYQAGELYSTTPSATDYLNHFALDTNMANLTKRTILCGTNTADYRRFRVHIYFVANNNVAGDGVPTLKRAELGANGFTIVPLVEGIETLQLEYGVDIPDAANPANPYDGRIDGFTPDPGAYNGCAGNACVQNWAHTYAVKVYLIARNTEKSQGYADSKSYVLGQKIDGTDNVFTPPSADRGYKRHAYSATVRLENPSGRACQPPAGTTTTIC